MTDEPEREDLRVTARLVGDDVQLPEGETVGVVSGVDESEDVIYVIENPSLVDRIMASMQWDDGEDRRAVPVERIREIHHDTVVVSGWSD
jgi:hypothetical protein